MPIAAWSPAAANGAQRPRPFASALLLTILVSFGLTACGSDNAGTTKAIVQPCAAGAEQACQCPDGASGAQVCGKGAYGPCSCQGLGDASEADTPVETQDSNGLEVNDGIFSDSAEVVADCPGGPGCPCKANTDCQTGVCIDDDSVQGSKACARKCQGQCPESYSCANVPGSGGDILNICVPKFAKLCQPCVASKDCEALGLKDSACVDQGSLGRFCGVVCGEASDCPADYNCTQVPTAEGGSLKQCVKQADA